LSRPPRSFAGFGELGEVVPRGHHQTTTRRARGDEEPGAPEGGDSTTRRVPTSAVSSTPRPARSPIPDTAERNQPRSFGDHRGQRCRAVREVTACWRARRAAEGDGSPYAGGGGEPKPSTANRIHYSGDPGSGKQAREDGGHPSAAPGGSARSYVARLSAQRFASYHQQDSADHRKGRAGASQRGRGCARIVGSSHGSLSGRWRSRPPDADEVHAAAPAHGTPATPWLTSWPMVFLALPPPQPVSQAS